MRSFQKLLQPDTFTAYVAEHPEDAGAFGDRAGDAWRNFRGDRDALEDAYNALANEQSGLCAYCEQLLFEGDAWVRLDRQIEHFEPKSSPTPGRVLVWENLMLCCTGGSRAELIRYPDRYIVGPGNQSCGQPKGDQEPAGALDPRAMTWRDIPYLVTSEGRLEVNPHASTELQRQAMRTLTLCNLNAPRLCYARKDVYQRIDEMLQWIEEALNHWNRTSRESARSVLSTLVDGELSPDAHGHLRAFWSVARQMLGPLAEEWLEANHAVIGM